METGRVGSGARLRPPLPLLATPLVQCLRSRAASVACLGVVVAALLLPPDGLGLQLCQFKNFTHLPCFGCGLTRSFIGMAHLNLARAGLYHPLGLVLFPLCVFVAALLPLPARRREQVAAWAEARPALVAGFATAVAVFFVAYGTGRIAWLLLTHAPSPW
jgi:hypothetical protein